MVHFVIIVFGLFGQLTGKNSGHLDLRPLYGSGYWQPLSLRNTNLIHNSTVVDSTVDFLQVKEAKTLSIAQPLSDSNRNTIELNRPNISRTLHYEAIAMTHHI